MRRRMIAIPEFVIIFRLDMSYQKKGSYPEIIPINRNLCVNDLISSDDPLIERQDDEI